jgi:hypothetical protein
MSGIEVPPRAQYFQDTCGWKAGMADYRAYTVGSDGHFIDYQGFACDNDAEATERARQLVNGHDIELWSGERFIIRLQPKPK